MDSNVSTTFVPLRPPFMIIKYGHDIGMQIGTLIATTQVNGGAEDHQFKIATRSFPVVAYENKETLDHDQSLFSHSLMEGVVWNRVELKNVSTVCSSNAHLSWEQFITILWDDHCRAPKTQEIQIRMFQVLRKYGVTIDLPEPGNYTIHLQVEKNGDIPETVRSANNDVFALNAAWDDDMDEIEAEIVGDLTSYLDIISPNRSAKGWKLTYEATEETLQPLVNKLNEKHIASGFSHVLVGRFTVSCMEPYEGESTDESIQAADFENQPRNNGDELDYNVFHENINENEVAKTLLKTNRLGLGPKQFAKAVQEFFISIGWLVDQIDTHFICWMKNHQVNIGKAKDLQHIPQNEKMNELKENLKKTFQFQSPKGIWEDKSDYFKKNRLRINKGEKA